MPKKTLHSYCFSWGLVICSLCVKSEECPCNISVNRRGVLLHLSREEASGRRSDADIWTLWWDEGEQPGCYRSHGVLDHWKDWLFGLVPVSVLVDQVKYSGGVVTYCRGPKLDQRMREFQWRVDAQCSASQQEISDENKLLSYQLKNMGCCQINVIISIIWKILKRHSNQGPKNHHILKQENSFTHN